MLRALSSETSSSVRSVLVAQSVGTNLRGQDSGHTSNFTVSVRVESVIHNTRQ